MRRSWDLIRQILRIVESTALNDFAIVSLPIPNVDPREVQAHVRLLIEAGFLGGDADEPGGTKPRFKIDELLWMGAEFLDASRDDAIWNQAMQISSVGSQPGSITHQTLLEILKKLKLMQGAVLGVP